MTMTQLSSKALHSLHNALGMGKERQDEAIGQRAAGMPVDAARFRAALASAFHRAADLQADLTVIFVQMRDCPAPRREEIARFLMASTPQRNAVFLPSERCFALILPEMGPAAAPHFTMDVIQRLQSRFPNTSFKFSSTGYPGEGYYA